MDDVTLVRTRIEPGKTERLREWFAELREREAEVLETLRHEGVYTETAFVDSTEDGDFLYYYMETADLDEAVAAGDEEAFEIDEQHHAVLAETLMDGRRELEPLGHFVNPDRP